MKKSVFSVVALLLLTAAFQSCKKDCEACVASPYCAKITKVVVKQFPSGVYDPSLPSPIEQRADIFFRFWDYDTDFAGSPVMIYEYPSPTPDADPNSSYTFNISDNICLFPGIQYRFSLYDYDTPPAAPDFIGAINFKVLDNDNDPNPIVLTGGTNGLICEVYVDYLQ